MQERRRFLWLNGPSTKLGTVVSMVGGSMHACCSGVKSNVNDGGPDGQDASLTYPFNCSNDVRIKFSVDWSIAVAFRRRHPETNWNKAWWAGRFKNIPKLLIYILCISLNENEINVVLRRASATMWNQRNAFAAVWKRYKLLRVFGSLQTALARIRMETVNRISWQEACPPLFDRVDLHIEIVKEHFRFSYCILIVWLEYLIIFGGKINSCLADIDLSERK